jgi:MerR family mercuric resistance operon transcriptional regulator
MHADPVNEESRRSIGQLARDAGVNVETIRFYQRRGLVPTPPKPAGGSRSYPEAALGQIAFIRRAQHLGFTLEEIGALQEIADGRDCRRGRDFAQRKHDELTHRVEALNGVRRQLAALVRKCDANDGTAACPFIRELGGNA